MNTKLISFLIIALLLLGVEACVNENLADLEKKANSDASSNTPSVDSTATSNSSGGNGSISTISFAKDIKPILSKYGCSNCHGSNYVSYNGVKSLAKSGLLYGTMSRASGYRAMPPSQHVTATELNKISTWIENGEPNN